MPALGFNSGRYDLNLVKRHFAEHLADTTNRVRVAKNGEKTMFLLTSGFRFLDIQNYLGPGTSYGKCVKAYGCTAEKSWFPYEWFDSADKPDFPELPDYEHWYLKLKQEFVCTREEWENCKRLFEEKQMKTFGLAAALQQPRCGPGLEALENMRGFYTEKGIDILKDAVFIPGVSMHYLLRGAVERGADLWSPRGEAYDMLKGAVVGGPSIVFKGLHEAGKT